MKRHLLLCSVAVASFLALTLSSEAQNSSKLGAGIGYGGGFDQLLVDFRYQMHPFDNIRNVDLAFNVDYYFVTGTYVTIDGNVHYEFMNFSRGGGLYGFAGLGISYYKIQFLNSTTGLSLNVGGGVHGPLGPFDAFAELKGVLIDNSQVVITGGFMFDI